MNIKFQSTGPSIDLAAIETLERALHRKLPTEYRNFLLKYNGGENPDRCVFKVETGESSLVRQFFSVHQLPSEISNLANELSPELIPIGVDVGGNRLCLAISGSSIGQIFFWDHEIGIEDVDETHEPVFFVARSFDELIDSLLKVPDRIISEIEQLGKNGTTGEVARFLEAGNDPEQKNNYGRTIAQEAARYGNLAVLKFCTEHGFKLKGAMHMAAMNRCMAAVDYLLACGIDINEEDEKGKKPLESVWDVEFARLLRLKGAIK